MIDYQTFLIIYDLEIFILFVFKIHQDLLRYI